MRAPLAMIAATIALVVTAVALAEKPNQTGRGRGQGQDGPAPSAAPSPALQQGGVTITISTADQHTVRQYYSQEATKGRCPPGLAKKNNGCLPPGQAKKWSMGHPLALSIDYYSLPPALLSRLSRPPAGYDYVQVGNDVLMIVVSSRTVVAAVSLF